MAIYKNNGGPEIRAKLPGKAPRVLKALISNYSVI